MRNILRALIVCVFSVPALGQQRPNIVWIVSEDNNPYIGAYGDALARTPNIDRLAQQGILYENCFSYAPVCAPSRFTLITGMYATSCGPANHMRASGKGPKELRGFPAYLRDAGYYTTNNAKTDYNAPINIKDTWDESSKQATYRNRPANRPFFAVFNFETTHESSVFPGKRDTYGALPEKTDPAAVRLPAYHPDTPEIRRDRAHYYDQMARMDAQVGQLLKQLEEDGVSDDTIVFYYGDNGGVLPRSKRFAYDSGLHVPLIVRFGKNVAQLAPAKAGARVTAPVSFVDFAPTVLSLANVEFPKYFEGQAFLGPKKGADREYAFSFRDRMDERYDMVRTARDRRYRYIRNYRPDLPWGQYVQFMWQQDGVRAWEKLFREGRLNMVQERFWGEKPAEELYDLKSDPDEVKNLMGSAEHAEVLKRMRAALREHLVKTRDNGFIPEEMGPEGHESARDATAYPIERVLELADVATARDPANLKKLQDALNDGNDVVRYWGALGILMLGEKAMPAKMHMAVAMSSDPRPQVRVILAEALVRLGEKDAGLKALEELLGHENNRVRLQAVNAITHLGALAKPLLPAVKKATTDPDDYVKRATRYLAAVLEGKEAPGEEQK